MKHLFSIILGLLSFCQLQAQSWTADNGNGTFTNPLFYDEFTDPDLIRVGTDFYMVASSMHAMPGLPLLRSKDLVNWEFVTYIFDRLDLRKRNMGSCHSLSQRYFLCIRQCKRPWFTSVFRQRPCRSLDT